MFQFGKNVCTSCHRKCIYTQIQSAETLKVVFIIKSCHQTHKPTCTLNLWNQILIKLLKDIWGLQKQVHTPPTLGPYSHAITWTKATKHMPLGDGEHVPHNSQFWKEKSTFPVRGHDHPAMKQDTFIKRIHKIKPKSVHEQQKLSIITAP